MLTYLRLKLNKLILQTYLEGQHSFMLFCFVYVWRALPPLQLQTSFWGTVFSSQNSLFIQLRKKKKHICFSVCIICKYSKFLNVFFQRYMVLL